MGVVDPGRPQELPMRIIAKLGTALATILFLGLVSVPALADDGVARVSVTNGNITLQHGDNGDTEAAVVNAPVSVGDYLSTGSGSHAEVQLDNNDFVRLSSDAQMRFAKLDPTDHQLQLAAGTAEVRVMNTTDANVQLDTPSITIRPDEPGAYRVSVDNNGTTILTVRSGQADLLGPQGAQTIDAGTSVQISGSSSNPQISQIDTIGYDDFDSWNSQRDSYEVAAASSPYVNSGVVGVDDLGTYGHWVYVSDYGNVWVPYDESAGWTPYQDGRWAWTPDYGWTWVGYEPWGWAPYHYGRWFYAAGYGWAWWPGPVYQPVAYCPGVVAFFGFGGGGGFSFGFGFSNVAWVPLAPYEPFNPWWGGGNVTNINITNINITNVNIYRNARGPHEAIAALTVRDFQNGFGNHHYLPVRASELRNVGLVTRKLAIDPSKANMRFTNDPVHIARPMPISPRFHSIAMLPQQHSGVAAQRSLGIQSRKSLGWGVLNTNTATTGRHLTVANPHVTATAPNVTAVGQHLPATAWDRFANARGMHTTAFSAPAASHSTLQPGGPILRSTQTGRSGFTGRPGAAFDNNIHTMVQKPAPSSAWSRFNSFHPASQTQFNGGAVTQHHAFTPDVRSSGTTRTFNGTGFTRQTYAPGTNRMPVNAPHVTSAPSSPWARFNGFNGANNTRASIPARGYSSMPARGYSNMPARSYNAPVRSYSMPTRSYSMPTRSYSMPTHTFSAPAYSRPSYNRFPSYNQPSYNRAPNYGGFSGSPQFSRMPARTQSQPAPHKRVH
jgi:hypothetical protein